MVLRLRGHLRQVRDAQHLMLPGDDGLTLYERSTVLGFESDLEFVDVLYTSLLANRRTMSDESLTEYDELNANRNVLSEYNRTRVQDNQNWKTVVQREKIVVQQ